MEVVVEVEVDVEVVEVDVEVVDVEVEVVVVVVEQHPAEYESQYPHESICQQLSQQAASTELEFNANIPTIPININIRLVCLMLAFKML